MNLTFLRKTGGILDDMCGASSTVQGLGSVSYSLSVVCVHAIHAFGGVAVRGKIAAGGDIVAGTVAEGRVPALPAVPRAEVGR